MEYHTEVRPLSNIGVIFELAVKRKKSFPPSLYSRPRLCQGLKIAPRACHPTLKTMIFVVIIIIIIIIIIIGVLRFWTKQTTKDSPLSHLLMLTPHG